MENSLAQTHASHHDATERPRMRRDVGWIFVVFIAAGAPALVMFNLGGISAVVGTISPLVWTVSVCLGFLELFVYAEIAGLHPEQIWWHRGSRCHRLGSLQQDNRANVYLVELACLEPNSGNRLRIGVGISTFYFRPA